MNESDLSCWSEHTDGQSILQHLVLSEVVVLVLVLQQIKPDAYTKIFQNSLEPDILNQILSSLQAFYVK